MQSQDSGASWQIVAGEQGSPFTNQAAGIYDLSCTGSQLAPAVCVGLGATSMQTPQQSFLVETQDGGKTWQQHPLPAGVVQAGYTPNLFSVQCTGSGKAAMCVVGGSNWGSNGSEVPFAFQSNDGGSTWSMINSLPSQGQIYAVSASSGVH